jgi:glycosyltransferase involved in cell wall biosynthesis
VLASDNENFGNVIPEAMWMERPVVVTDGVGASELVRIAEAGIVCAPDPDALRSALLALAGDRERAQKLGQAGASYARAHLSWDRVAQRMLALYEGS